MGACLSTALPPTTNTLDAEELKQLRGVPDGWRYTACEEHLNAEGKTVFVFTYDEVRGDFKWKK